MYGHMYINNACAGTLGTRPTARVGAPNLPPIEFESLGVGAYGYGFGGVHGAGEGGEEGGRWQCWFAAAPQSGYF